MAPMVCLPAETTGCLSSGAARFAAAYCPGLSFALFACKHSGALRFGRTLSAQHHMASCFPAAGV